MGSEVFQLTGDYLRKHILYDPVSGAFTWVKTKHKVRPGQTCGALNGGGYRMIGIKGRYYQAHRLAYLYMLDRWPTGPLDHIDRNRDNNAWANLREASPLVNAQNSHAAPNKHGVKGVYYDRRVRKWVASIRVSGKPRYLGAFHSPQAAGDAYVKAKAAFHTPAVPQNPPLLI